MSQAPERTHEANGAAAPATAAARRPLGGVTSTTRALPNRLCLYAREGWGKTSFAAQAPGVVFCCTRGEDGLDKLIETGQVRDTAHFAEPPATWGDLLARVDELAEAEHDYRVFALDTMNGAYDLLLRSVIADSFGGSTFKASEYGGEQASKIAAGRLSQLTARLDRLRVERRMSIALLCHANVVKTPNPEGADFERWTPAMEKKHVWPELARWCDLVLFGSFETYVSQETRMVKGKEVAAGKGKAQGGSHRVLKTTAEAWYDAKNRHGLAGEIDCGENAAHAWAAFVGALKAARPQ